MLEFWVSESECRGMPVPTSSVSVEYYRAPGLSEGLGIDIVYAKLRFPRVGLSPGLRHLATKNRRSKVVPRRNLASMVQIWKRNCIVSRGIYRDFRWRT